MADVLELASDQAEIESVCVNCGSNGITRMLLTKIPHFNDVVVMSFECSKCPYKDNEIQNIASLKDYGVNLRIRVDKIEGLNNQIVITNTSTVKLTDIDFEIPKIDRKGIITTLEGVITNVVTNLTEHINSINDLNTHETQDDLKIELSTGTQRTHDLGETITVTEYTNKLVEIKNRLLKYVNFEEVPRRPHAQKFNIEIDDPSGNSYVENNDNIALTVTKYQRTNDQLKEMGYLYDEPETNDPADADAQADKVWDLNKPLDESKLDEEEESEAISFAVDCPNCGKKGQNQICQIRGGIKKHGKRYYLHIGGPRDLNRDVILSDTASVKIEELQLEMSPGTIGSCFTSIEGIINKIIDSMKSTFPFEIGDSYSEASQTDQHKSIKKTLDRLSDLMTAYGFNLVIDDPINNTFVSPLNSANTLDINKLMTDPGIAGQTEGPANPAEGDFELGERIKLDDNLFCLLYSRTFEQNEALGLNDMNVDNY